MAYSDHVEYQAECGFIGHVYNVTEGWALFGKTGFFSVCCGADASRALVKFINDQDFATRCLCGLENSENIEKWEAIMQ